MSTIIMSACWPLQMPSAAKAVLMSLADNANDQGVCWPSQPHIAMRTCLSVRAVRNAIKWLEVSGYLSVDRSNGRHATYTLHPTPARGAAPAPDAAPARCAAEPRHQVPQPRHQVPPNHKEPSRTVIKKKDASAPRSSSGEPVDCPADVRPEIWRDWLALRKRKRAEVTPTVVEAARREADKAGMTMGEFLTEWCLRGSQGLKADWLKPNERNNGGNPNGSRRESVAGRIARINAEAASRGHDIDGEYRLV